MSEELPEALEGGEGPVDLALEVERALRWWPRLVGEAARAEAEL
jgi:hypothetical protein